MWRTLHHRASLWQWSSWRRAALVRRHGLRACSIPVPQGPLGSAPGRGLLYICSLLAVPPPARLALLLDSPQSTAPFPEPIPTHPQKSVSSPWQLSLLCSWHGVYLLPHQCLRRK